jgi:hypothetical protein
MSVNAGKENIIIGVCYKSPTISDDELVELFKVLNQVANSDVVIVGDFNYPNINWNNLHGNSTKDNDFINLTLDCFFEQLVDKPTRVNNILDLVLTNAAMKVTNLTVGEQIANSDHNLISFHLNINCALTESKLVKRNIKKANFNKIKKCLSGMHWEGII